MKNIELWSRQTDWNILIAGGSLLLAAVTGLALPTPAPLDHIEIFDAFITTLLIILVWAAFHLVRPAGWSPKWSVAEFIAVPAVWLLLVVALAVWFYHLHGEWDIHIESLFPRVL